jgi:DNA-3-methyladenine glycosylase
VSAPRPGPSRPLGRAFFRRAPDRVAPDLLGQLLVRQTGGRRIVGRIVEVEAYLGKDDPAAHAFRGKTRRNATLFGPPGHAYVYTSYGLHQCLNVSTQPAGQAGCVLIRGLEPWPPAPPVLRWLQARAPARDARRLLSGPGRLCRALAIGRDWDGADLTTPGGLWLAVGPAPRRIAVTRRIGIQKAVERPLRFYDLESAAVSGRRGPVVMLLSGGRGRWRVAGAAAPPRHSALPGAVRGKHWARRPGGAAT